jgi:molecular chaperone GrpE (heat shock protein)
VTRLGDRLSGTAAVRAGTRDGEVIEEFARGYMQGDRLLRPAKVKVAKG